MRHRGHDAGRGHAAAGSPAAGAGSPRSARGDVASRCLSASLATVGGARPISRATSRHPFPLSGILSMACRSCLVSLAQALSDGAFFFDIAASPRSRAGLSGPPRGDYPPDPSIRVALSVGIVSLKLEIKGKVDGMMFAPEPSCWNPRKRV